MIVDAFFTSSARPPRLSPSRLAADPTRPPAPPPRARAAQAAAARGRRRRGRGHEQRYRLHGELHGELERELQQRWVLRRHRGGHRRRRPRGLRGDGPPPRPGSKVLIGRDSKGLYALTSICTHELCDMDEKQGARTSASSTPMASSATATAARSTTSAPWSRALPTSPSRPMHWPSARASSTSTRPRKCRSPSASTPERARLIRGAVRPAAGSAAGRGRRRVPGARASLAPGDALSRVESSAARRAPRTPSRRPGGAWLDPCRRSRARTGSAPDSAWVMTASMNTRTAGSRSSRSGYTSRSYACAPRGTPPWLHACRRELLGREGSNLPSPSPLCPSRDRRVDRADRLPDGRERTLSETGWSLAPESKRRDDDGNMKAHHRETPESAVKQSAPQRRLGLALYHRS